MYKKIFVVKLMSIQVTGADEFEDRGTDTYQN